VEKTLRCNCSTAILFIGWADVSMELRVLVFCVDEVILLRQIRCFVATTTNGGAEDDRLSVEIDDEGRRIRRRRRPSARLTSTFLKPFLCSTNVRRIAHLLLYRVFPVRYYEAPSSPSCCHPTMPPPSQATPSFPTTTCTWQRRRSGR
jgi:hypothetical protein